MSSFFWFLSEYFSNFYLLIIMIAFLPTKDWSFNWMFNLCLFWKDKMNHSFHNLIWKEIARKYTISSQYGRRFREKYNWL